MDAFIRMVPGWENLLLGVQTGVWAALIGIFIVGIIARQLLIYLFPLIMKPITGKVDSVNEFEMRSRVSSFMTARVEPKNVHLLQDL